mgnify:CR=1 FL=1
MHFHTYLPPLLLPSAAELRDPRIGGWGTWCRAGYGKTKGDKKRVYNIFDYWFYIEEIQGQIVPVAEPVKTGK